ncbi:MAG TPA: hypothetical protein VJV78_40905 [Polyangiales bacterium]|nr:hypothetical protein [Polyangiales bacterium]
MRIPIGIFDFAAYAVPGSLYLAALVPCALGLLLASIMMRRAGRARIVWAKLKTLECAAWIEGIDALFGEAAAPAVASERAPDLERLPQLDPTEQVVG